MYLTPSGGHEVSQQRDTDIKPKLIKRLYKTVAILITISLALYPLYAGAVEAERPENTYSPDVVEVTPLPPTQETIATTTPMNMAGTTPVYQQYDTEEVVAKILKVLPPIMVYVAKCESGLDPLADRQKLNVDVGLFQINQVHKARLAELGLDRRDIDDNIAYTVMLYNESGLGPWYMSKHCWDKYL